MTRYSILLLTVASLLFGQNCIGQTPSFDLSISDTICYIDSSSLNHCSCSMFTIISPKIKASREPGMFDGPGTCWTSALYDKDKRIIKCGFFTKTKLAYGLSFSYSDNGVVTKVEKYYKGVVIGVCKPE